jgi:hypothetical protein
MNRNSIQTIGHALGVGITIISVFLFIPLFLSITIYMWSRKRKYTIFLLSLGILSCAFPGIAVLVGIVIFLIATWSAFEIAGYSSIAWLKLSTTTPKTEKRLLRLKKLKQDTY